MTNYQPEQEDHLDLEHLRGGTHGFGCPHSLGVLAITTTAIGPAPGRGCRSRDNKKFV